MSVAVTYSQSIDCVHHAATLNPLHDRGFTAGQPSVKRCHGRWRRQTLQSKRRRNTPHSEGYANVNAPGSPILGTGRDRRGGCVVRGHLGGGALSLGSMIRVTHDTGVGSS